MANVYVSKSAVNKIARNKRPYTGSISQTKAGSSSAGIHIEHDRLTELSIRNITVEFTSKFNDVPSGWVKVYRMKETTTGNGKWKQWDVLYYHTSADWKTVDGFSLQIDASENLTGIIVEYLFI